MRSNSYYERLLNSVELLPEFKDDLEIAMNKIKSNMEHYTRTARAACASPELLAVLHWMEAGCDMERQILNGEPWNQKTKLTPRGVGPFESWHDSAVYGMRPYVGINTTCTTVLRLLEAHNGWGYFKRNVNSPYLWSGTNHGVCVGKFTSDGQYDAHAVSKQLGAAPIVYQLFQKTTTIQQKNCVRSVFAYDRDGSFISENRMELQDFLAEHTGEDLRIDGWLGTRSSNAFRYLFGFYLFGDPRA